MELTFKQGDTHNAIKSTITKDGEPIPLKDCKVFISVSGIVFEEECTVIDEGKGVVAYPASKLSGVDGWYNYEYIIKYKDGTKEIVPNQGYKKLRIYDRIKE